MRKTISWLAVSCVAAWLSTATGAEIRGRVLDSLGRPVVLSSATRTPVTNQSRALYSSCVGTEQGG